jgi:IS30 family transposase
MPPARHDGDGPDISEIARRLGRHRSTMQRELARNRCVDGYRPDSAERRAWARKLRGSKIARSTGLRAHVVDRLAMGWSPEQIAGRMERDGRHGMGRQTGQGRRR